MFIIRWICCCCVVVVGGAAAVIIIIVVVDVDGGDDVDDEARDLGVGARICVFTHMRTHVIIDRFSSFFFLLAAMYVYVCDFCRRSAYASIHVIAR